MWLGHAEFQVPVYRALMWTHSINGSSMVLERGRDLCDIQTCIQKAVGEDTTVLERRSRSRIRPRGVSAAPADQERLCPASPGTREYAEVSGG